MSSCFFVSFMRCWGWGPKILKLKEVCLKSGVIHLPLFSDAIHCKKMDGLTVFAIKVTKFHTQSDTSDFICIILECRHLEYTFLGFVVNKLSAWTEKLWLWSKAQLVHYTEYLRRCKELMCAQTNCLVHWHTHMCRLMCTIYVLKVGRCSQEDLHYI